MNTTDESPALHLFTAVLLAISSLSLLASRDFPNGLFSLKELAFYFLAGSVSVVLALSLVFRMPARTGLFSLVDVLVLQSFVP